MGYFGMSLGFFSLRHFTDEMNHFFHTDGDFSVQSPSNQRALNPSPEMQAYLWPSLENTR